MRAYYNDNDPKVCAWLRELIARGLITDGDVDDRSIAEVTADDLAGYDRVHFFAGIGGWDYALQLAGWGDRPVWTGSCPCQPFSTAGRRGGADDERHFWPEFGRLIAECGPPVVFGEQVASKAGRSWLAGVRTDLEVLGYAVGAADLCAAGIGAPHIRQRLWWVADSGAEQRQQCEADDQPARGAGTDRLSAEPDAGGRGEPGGVGNAQLIGSQCRGQHKDQPARRIESAGFVHCRDGKARRIEPGTPPLAHGLPARVVRLRGYGNAIVPQVAAEFVAAYMECEDDRTTHA